MDSSATPAAVQQAWMIAKAAKKNRIALLLASAAVKRQWNTPAVKFSVRAVFPRLHVTTKT